MHARLSLLFFTLLASAAAQSSLTVKNSCTSKVSVCGPGGGFIYDLQPGESKTNQPSGPYNQCGSVQAEVNLDGYDSQNCYDLSEVAFKQSGAAVSLAASNGPALTCSGSPCSDATQSGGAAKVHCVRGPATVTFEFCPSGSVASTGGQPSSTPSSSVAQPAAQTSTVAATSSSTVAATPSSTVSASSSTLTIKNSCPTQVDVCGAGGGYIYSLAAGASQTNQPSGPYNQCGSVQAEVNLDGYDSQNCYDLSEVAFKQSGAAVSLAASNGPALTCSGSPCSDATQSGGAAKVHCVRGPATVTFEFCPSGSATPTSQASVAAEQAAVTPTSTSAPSASTGDSTFTIFNNCPNQVDVCGAGGGYIYSLAAGASQTNQPSGPYNQCGSVQAEVNLNGYDSQNCYDLSEVAFKQSGAAVTLYSSNGPTLTCSSTPCASATQSGGAPKVSCVRGPSSVFLQFC